MRNSHQHWSKRCSEKKQIFIKDCWDSRGILKEFILNEAQFSFILCIIHHGILPKERLSRSFFLLGKNLKPEQLQNQELDPETENTKLLERNFSSNSVRIEVRMPPSWSRAKVSQGKFVISVGRMWTRVFPEFEVDSFYATRYLNFYEEVPSKFQLWTTKQLYSFELVR